MTFKFFSQPACKDKFLIGPHLEIEIDKNLLVDIEISYLFLIKI